ncbi:MAG: tetratricopeptide repeat protein [Candidatus Edwardsbacteria bacterium]|nr:tetratricopeptide repeat protein [Candidatus Edwardsbacteria bacterium]
MIRWAAPQYLYLLLAIPALAAALAAGAWLKKRQYRNLADADLIPRLADSRNGKLALIKSVLLVTGFFFLIVALARPKWSEKLQIYKGRGIDIVIALDASKSMLAADVKPNRLERAKNGVAQLLDNLSTNQVGITEFAGDCYVMCPLTPDVEAAKLFLDVIEPGNVPKPGTNIQRAIEVSSSLFNPKEDSYKALVLITDGDNLEGDPMAAAQAAASQGVRIFAVGVGTLEGSTVPDDAGDGASYKKDKDDRLVISRLAERMLLVMAKATDGRYFRSETMNLDNLAAALDQMKKKEIGGGEFVEYEERYQYFLAIAFVLIFLGVFISDRKGPWFPKMNMKFPRFKFLRFSFFILIFASFISPARADIGSSMREGNALADKGKYDEALRKYQEALVLEPDNVKIHYNIARAFYKAGKYPEAISEYQLCMLTKDTKLQARTMYNIGNCQFRQQRLDDAIGAYTASLLLNPNDTQAKQNLEFCLREKDKQNQGDSTKQNQRQSAKGGQPQQSATGGQQQPKPQPQKGEIRRDQADRILQALQDKEKENLKKQKERTPQPEKTDKDW